MSSKAVMGIYWEYTKTVVALAVNCACCYFVSKVIPQRGDLDSVMTSLRHSDEKYQDASVSSGGQCMYG